MERTKLLARSQKIAWIFALGVVGTSFSGAAQAEQSDHFNISTPRVATLSYHDLGGGGQKDVTLGEDLLAPTPDELADVPAVADFSGGLAAAPVSAMPGLVGGYIDPAVIATRFRLRYDNFEGANAPTRAEFLYPTVASLGGNGPAVGGIGLADEVDFEEVSAYFEWAVLPRLSFFGEAPVRWVGPIDLGTGTETQRGAGDIKVGVRLGLINYCDQALTLQTRFWTPTGEASRAIGVGHSSIDVALLYQGQLSDRLTVFGELQDWQTISDTGTVTGGPFDGADLDGNVLRYGVGLGYDLWADYCTDRRVTGVFEVVGWEVLDGLVTPLDGNAANVRDANGDSIVNGKYGLRLTSGCNSVYVGYGHNWTSERWYSDLFRLEFAREF